MSSGRCPWAIKWGVSDDTVSHCDRTDGHDEESHEGPGLPQFPYQRIEWFPGDRREFRVDG